MQAEILVVALVEWAKPHFCFGVARVSASSTSAENCVADQACNALQVVELMELGPLAGALVGAPGQSGLSVEQRKRLTIGVELCANPSVIFMDEPTSGDAHQLL